MQKVKIKSIKKIENRDKYELEVKDNHNFFVNGILKHNCRLITIYKDGDIKFYSRAGLEFTSLNILKGSLISLIETCDLRKKDFVLDGEICIVDGSGLEIFKDIVKVIKKKDYTIPIPLFKIFDMLDYDDFSSCESTETYIERHKNLLSNFSKCGFVDIVSYLNYSENNFEMMKKEVDIRGWEGLILRNGGVGYEGKRTKNILKIKTFYDAEYTVIDIYPTTKPILINGVMVETVMMGGLHIRHKGNEVGVGSGFSDQQRIDFNNDPSLIIGKVITVKYKQETENEKGDKSLQFPTLKNIHGDERDV